MFPTICNSFRKEYSAYTSAVEPAVASRLMSLESLPLSPASGSKAELLALVNEHNASKADCRRLVHECYQLCSQCRSCHEQNSTKRSGCRCSRHQCSLHNSEHPHKDSASTIFRQSLRRIRHCRIHVGRSRQYLCQILQTLRPTSGNFQAPGLTCANFGCSLSVLPLTGFAPLSIS